MKTIMDAAIAAETNGVVLNASVFGGFPLADIPHVGLSIVLVAEPSQLVNAQALLDTLTRMAWERREDFMCDFDSFGSSIAYAHKLDSFPIVLADHGDNCASGGTTDNMEVLREVLKQGLQEVIAGPFWDPGAVDQLIGLGVGGQCTIDIGGKTDVPALGERGIPLSVSATVIAITDGVYTVTGPMFTGMRLSLGRTVLIDIGAAQIVLSEKPQEPFDLGVFTHAGVDPASKRYILIKSKQHFRAGFEPIAKHVVMIAGPGVCSSDFSRFPYQHLSRPIFPLDLHVACTDGDQWLPSQQHQ